ncbi:hypothetical protein [Corynebacterium cystitidis]|uniref:Uncharacterized protein n=1 Tax=Corynebacterium cystitidis DSM 20524 TaxID=1121357 RepID=A0A1H9TC44_9CORY|nr:hypothetical protein [Corynebacterium cystitidis]WJY83550.1 hypothetical protein CCYS_13330 [Corynebacterium cystitidis DSM 20524]SER94688.1 hypothetical protein SAMN05661109_01406 [Corynebacterium cystitidis DSM 20524]SNV92149.1 Uncharacterised protein [Corynebacterium cystitidis]
MGDRQSETESRPVIEQLMGRFNSADRRRILGHIVASYLRYIHPGDVPPDLVSALKGDDLDAISRQAVARMEERDDLLLDAYEREENNSSVAYLSDVYSLATAAATIAHKEPKEMHLLTFMDGIAAFTTDPQVDIQKAIDQWFGKE